MKVEFISVHDLKPYSRNNKVHDAKAIDEMAKSLGLFGWTQPIVVDEDNSILAGHKRFFAAVKIGQEQVPVHRMIGLDEARKAQYRIVDNKMSAAPEWDYQAIEAELVTLQEADLEVEEFGLDEFIDKENQQTKTAASGQSAGDVGYSIQYTLVFDNEDQQTRFYEFLRHLKEKYNADTTAGRIDQFLTDHMESI